METKSSKSKNEMFTWLLSEILAAQAAGVAVAVDGKFYSLQEAEELSHQNWLEIQHLRDRICQLETFIRTEGLPFPEKLD